MLKTLTYYCEISEDGTVLGMTVPLHKPIDWTSFDVVNKCRYATGFKKVGHAGTLDPFAEGVLILGFGKHTKLLDEHKHKDKVYRVDIELGKETDTLDGTGQILKSTKEVSPPALDDIQAVLPKFTGEITQIPPMYSAKKVKGKRLYTLARAGKIIERDPIRVRINAIDILEYEWPRLTCRVSCSTGTYIRTLAADIGSALGCGAYANALVREQVGDITLDECYTIEAFIEAWKSIVHLTK
ncbi:MAG: tRNA pseudouridine(55) synthase TruB [Candidatus Marinimicrobia bacterium]|nr:tRNA pseudouridine(55) synthase TruB [Candidatus Neomarinimicrobiota bacterium]